MNFILFILFLALQFVLLPVVPEPDDRIVAARRFREARPSYLQFREHGWRRFIRRWLESAGRRQERYNAIHGPVFREVQRRKWERAFAYQFAAKKWGLYWALYYGTEQLDPLVRLHCPSLYACLLVACNWFNHLLGTILR